MRKRIMLLTLMLFLFIPIKVYAESTTVEVKVSGEIKKGEEIDIIVNVKDLQGLYAASINFTYDKNILNILEITPGETLKKHSDEIMEIGGEVDSENNKTSYSFTFLGDKEGISDSATLATIKAKVLSNDNINIGQDTLEVKLVKRANDTVENYEYKFVGYSKETNKPSTGENQSNSNPGNSSSSEGESSNNNVNNNSTNDENKNESNNNQGNNSENLNEDSNINSDTNNQDLVNKNEDNNKTSEDNNNTSSKEDNNSDSNKNNSNSQEDKEIVDNNENDKEIKDNKDVDSSKDDKETESKKDNKLILIISLLIVFSIFAGVIYYKRKKVKFSE